MRWLRRATDIGLNLPDAIILMKGINKLSKRILTQQPDLQFRCALVKNTLQLDTIPNEETVRTYAEHLLAELETAHASSPTVVEYHEAWKSGRWTIGSKGSPRGGQGQEGRFANDFSKGSLPILPHRVWMSKGTVVQMGTSTGDW